MTVLNKGFRPFFIGAPLVAMAFVPVWLLQMNGIIDVAGTWTPSLWHGHEMVYGFALAVVSGFLLTAVENWTGRVTARGPWLALLFGLWLAGRLAMLGADVLPAGLVAAVDLAYLPALAAAVGRALTEAKNRRNYVFFALLAVLGGTNLVMHLEVLGLLEGLGRTALWLAVDLIIVMALIVGGRIIPLFTRNATGASGINVRSSDLADAIDAGDVNLGDRILVGGELGAFSGLLQIGGDVVFRVDQGGVGVPTPQTITVADTQNGGGEDYESEFVAVEQLTFEDGGGTFESGTNYAAEGPNGNTITVRITSNSFYSGASIPTGEVTVQAPLSQFNAGFGGAREPDEGYQLLPLLDGDIQ